MGFQFLSVGQCGSGHESAGEVAEVGEGVTTWKVGEDRDLCDTRRTLLTRNSTKVIALPLRRGFPVRSHPVTIAVLADIMLVRGQIPAGKRASMTPTNRPGYRVLFHSSFPWYARNSLYK